MEFVVSTSGRDENPGTPAQPFRTIRRGVDRRQAGDVLTVRQGTYVGAVVITRKTGIRIQSAPGERAVIDARDAAAELAVLEEHAAVARHPHALPRGVEAEMVEDDDLLVVSRRTDSSPPKRTVKALQAHRASPGSSARSGRPA